MCSQELAMPAFTAGNVNHPVARLWLQVVDQFLDEPLRFILVSVKVELVIVGGIEPIFIPFRCRHVPFLTKVTLLALSFEYLRYPPFKNVFLHPLNLSKWH
jgi:hypothetical protein